MGDAAFIPVGGRVDAAQGSRGRALVGVHWTSATVLLGGVLEHFASLNASLKVQWKRRALLAAFKALPLARLPCAMEAEECFTLR